MCKFIYAALALESLPTPVLGNRPTSGRQLAESIYVVVQSYSLVKHIFV